MKRILPLMAFLALGAAAAPSSAVFLVGFPEQPSEAVEPIDYEVLGGFDKTWLEGKNTPVPKGLSYTVWNLSGKQSRAANGSAKESYGPPCEDTFGVKVSPPPSRKNWVIASTAPWNLRPRPVVILANNNSIYRTVVSDYLKAKGIKTPEVKITSVVRTDLDGDKQDEIIIAATRVTMNGNLPAARANLNDYSVLLVRKVVAGKVQTFALGEEIHLKVESDEDIKNGIYGNNPDLWELVNVLDLNGDGKLEVIFFNAIYEDYGVFALEWAGNKFEQRLVSGCGS